MLNSKETTTSVEVRTSSREAPSIAEAITERSTTSQRYKDAKPKLVNSKVATPNETMGDIDEPNSTSSSQQNKNIRTHKRRDSTDLLLIAAAQKEAIDSKKSAANSGHSRKIIEKKVSSSPTKGQQKQQPPTKASGRNKGTPQPHVYHDYSAVPDTVGYTRKKTGGVSTPFPEKLMEMLSRESSTNSSIVSWLPHGRAFIVRKPKEFSEDIMHKYFRQTKITSFQRQLNLYGFRRLTQGPDTGAYYHEMFLRGRMQLAARMTRQKVKGIGHKQPSHRESEPNLYALPHLPEDSPNEAGTIPLKEDANCDMGNTGFRTLLAGLHQTPTAATKYYHPSSIAAAAARNNVTAGIVTGASPPLASPAIQAAQLLKSMATAKVTPGSFPTMLTWAPTSNSSSSSTGGGDASNKHEATATTALLPPPPPLHAAEKSSMRKGRGHRPEDGDEANEEGASRATADAACSSSKMNVDSDDDEEDDSGGPPLMPSVPSQ